MFKRKVIKLKFLDIFCSVLFIYLINYCEITMNMCKHTQKMVEELYLNLMQQFLEKYLKMILVNNGFYCRLNYLQCSGKAENAGFRCVRRNTDMPGVDREGLSGLVSKLIHICLFACSVD